MIEQSKEVRARDVEVGFGSNADVPRMSTARPLHPKPRTILECAPVCLRTSAMGQSRRFCDVPPFRAGNFGHARFAVDGVALDKFKAVNYLAFIKLATISPVRPAPRAAQVIAAIPDNRPPREWLAECLLAR